MEIVNVPAIARTNFGKLGTKKFRKEGKIPAVIYGGPENVHCGVKKNDVKSLIYTPEFKLAEVEVDGKKYKCLIKDIQFHPVSDAIVHIDFHQLVDGVQLKAELPLVCEGVSLGQKEGGKLMQSMRKIKVKTTPDKLVDKLVVDISSLELGMSARVRDIKVEEGVQIMSPEATPVASVEVPRALKSAAAAAEAVKATPADGDEASEEGATEGAE